MGYVDRSPMRSLDKPRADSRDRLVTLDEYRAVLNYATDSGFRDLVVTAWETGCRPQELLRVEARHFDSRNARWVFTPKESKGMKRPRIVYLTDRSLEITKRLAADHPNGPLFRNSKGRLWTPYAVNCRFQRVRKKLSLSLCLYNFRHTFATRILESGLDALTVALLLGHANAPKLGLQVATCVVRDLQAYRDAAQQGTVVGRFGRKGAQAAADIDALFTELLADDIAVKRQEGRQRVENG